MKFLKKLFNLIGNKNNETLDYEEKNAEELISEELQEKYVEELISE